MLIVILLLCLAYDLSASSLPPHKRILVLHSFHKGQKWNDDISQGITDVIGTAPIDLHFEYMDAKRFSDEYYYANLFRLYQYKYQIHPVDVIISTDESALDFLLRFRDEIFPGVPVVFCGIKYMDENKLYGEKKITGVIEQVDIEKSVQLILRLGKNVNRIMILIDNSPTSVSTIRRFIPVLRKYDDRIDFHFTELMAMERLTRTLRSLPEGTAVLLVNYTKDINDNILSMQESAQLITRNSAVPVYALWNNYLGNGILGGLLIRGYEQGQTAARMALSILQNEEPAAIPEIQTVTGRYMFDYLQMQRYGVAKRQLPGDSIIINQPMSVFYQYRRLIILVILAILGMSLVILILSFNIAKRRRVEQSLKKHEEELISMSANIIEAQERERKRLSVDLHDEFGQTLTAVGLNLSLIKNRLGSKCSDTVRSKLMETEQSIEHLYDQVHDLSHDLRPTILDDLGLAPTLRWYLNQYGDRTGIDVQFTANEKSATSIPDPVAVAFYRVLQEALTNITKYSQATTIQAVLEVDIDHIRLTISDNGIGFDTEEALSRNNESRGLGLVGMRERMELLNGSFKISSAKGIGTSIEAFCYLKQEGEPWK